MQKGKFGWHPCDWETYRKLKALNMAYDKARYSKARWAQWDRKEPQNRVMRARIRDSSGRIIGYEASVPLPEPEICSIFCRKVVKKAHWDKNGNYNKDGKDKTFVEMVDLPIYEDYRKARYPVKAEEACESLSLKLVEIDELYDKFTKG